MRTSDKEFDQCFEQLWNILVSSNCNVTAIARSSLFNINKTITSKTFSFSKYFDHLIKVIIFNLKKKATFKSR